VRPSDVPIKTAAKSTKKRPIAKGRIKSSTVAIYASVFVLLVSVIAIGYRAPQQTAATATASVANVTENVSQPTVNEVVATDIAASVAQAADLAVAPNVAELAVSTRIQSEFQNVSGDTSAISKPAIVQLSSASRNITTYAVQPGDTVASVAEKYNLSENTIKWANNLKGNDLTPGSNLEILPRNGVAYTTKDGDTVQSIAEKYKADVALITTYNDLEIKGITAGTKIIIPDGVLPETERPGYVAPQTRSSSYGYIIGYSAGFGGRTWHIKTGTPMYAGNKYAYGNCTAYAYDRRMEMGMALPPVTWGNAATWASYAQAAGYRVDHTPSVGAVMQNGGGYGHVAIVERLLPNGDIEISEMNAYVSGGGFNQVSGRIVSASSVGQYLYIH